MLRPTKIIVTVTIILVGLFIFYWWLPNKSKSQAVDYAGQVEEFKSSGVPPFHLPIFDVARGALDGSLGLADVTSKIVLINFWASWCEPCIAEFPSLIELASRYPDSAKLTILAISLDKDLNALNTFFDLHRPRSDLKNFVVLLDKDFSVPRKYGTKKIPETYVVGERHKLLMKVIDSQNWLSADFLAFLNKAVSGL